MLMGQTKKGVSPVISTVVLLAAGLAVSIFVASWVTLVVPTYARHEELRIQNCVIVNSQRAMIYLKNTGNIDLTINHVLINGKLSNPGEPVNTILESGDTTRIEIDPTHYTDVKEFKPGTRYDFVIHTVTGLSYPTSARAP
jgi:hypothetical protein